MSKFNTYFGKWAEYLNEENVNTVLRTLNSEGLDNLCPAFPDIFKAFKLCPFEKLKVVMVGMDPYPQKGVATGLLFGNKAETNEEDLSPSLKVIKESCINYERPHGHVIFDNTLEEWAQQGVLLLNAALTTKVGHTGIHTMLWRPVISEFLKKLSSKQMGLVFVMFGETAKSFIPYIDTKYNFVLTEKHPAYYARIESRMPQAVFCGIKEYIKNYYGEKIDFYKEVKY